MKNIKQLHAIKQIKLYKRYYDNICDSCESKIHEQLINELTKDNK